MSNCNPNDLKVNINDAGTPNIISGFGLSLAPNITTDPNDGLDGYGPPDLSELYKLFDLFVPGGSLKQPYNLKIDQSAFDAILKYLDKAYPYLMLYKLLLPLLEIILCVIEVLCSIPNPFKVARAIRRLFRNCIPNFLSLFPIFALPLFLLSLLLLLLALIEHILQQVAKAIDLLIKNILYLRTAINRNDPVAHKAIMRKIAWLLCSIQNLFVVLMIFKSIFDVIKDILSKAFTIPACADSDSDDSCCSKDVCPAFFKHASVTAETGTLQYLSEISRNADVSSILPNFPSNAISVNIRQPSIQLFDTQLSQDMAFINIARPYDLDYDKSFFPKGTTYTKDTSPQSAPYTVDLRIFYKPSEYQRYDSLGDRFVRIKNCIVIKEPVNYLVTYDNSNAEVNSGVIYLAGGKVFEEDGKTPLNINGAQATIDTLISKPAQRYDYQYVPPQSDAVRYEGVSYTLNINHEVLSMTYGLITSGCIPDVAADKAAVAATIGNVGIKQQELMKIFTDGFPDIDGALSEINAALTAFRNNVSVDGANLLRDSTNAAMNKLKEDAAKSAEKLILASLDPYKSKISLDTDTQFTTLPIKFMLEPIDSNGQPLASNLPASIASEISKKISVNSTFGKASQFEYDGSKYFYSNITSTAAGSGSAQLLFNGNIVSNLDIPSDLSKPISVSPKSLDYRFIFASPIGNIKDIDSDQVRDQSDVANDASNSSDVSINNGDV